LEGAIPDELPELVSVPDLDACDALIREREQREDRGERLRPIRIYIGVDLDRV
jgi:hypothetical protein